MQLQGWSTTDSLQGRTEPVRQSDGTSLQTRIKKGKNVRQTGEKNVRNSSVNTNTKLSEEGEGGGAPGAGVSLAACGRDHDGAGISPQQVDIS